MTLHAGCANLKKTRGAWKTSNQAPRRTPLMSTTICKVCGCKILEGSTISCPRCETPHHADCWEYNNGCSVFACNPGTKAVLVGKDALGQPSPRRKGPGIVTALAGIAILNILGVL